MKQVKVLHVTFDMTIGGAQQVIRQLVENMDETKIHSEIVCIDNKLGELGETLQEQGIKIHLLNRQSGFDFSLVKALYKIIKSNKFNVIHCHQYTPYVYGLLAAIVTPAKVIFTEHGRFYPDYGTWKRKLINPIFSLFTYKITTISKATKEALVKYENFKSNKIEVIYNGIKDCSDIEVDEKALKKQFNIPQNTFIYGTISRLQPIKNQAMMIEAFKKVNMEYPNTHLLMVGDGDIKQNLMTLVDDLNITNKVTFTGFQKDPYRFHKIIDIFLLSSFSEGTSMTVLEAMSFYKPSVLTSVGGNPEIIRNEKDGFLVPSDDVDEFANCCLKLVVSEQLRKQMGLSARAAFEEQFKIKTMAMNYEKIYFNAL